jgi:class 3 adenylate cyclase
VSQIPLDPDADPAGGQVCAVLALDIAGFTRPDRDEEVRIYLHKALYEILREALQGSGIPWDRCHHEDRGDGALVVMPPDIPAHRIINPLPERLRGLIRVHNRMSFPAARIQVRAAAHIGPVYRDDHGLVGDDINLLFRMLNARPLQTALAGSDAELALAISRYMYDSLIRRHPALAGPAVFRQINTRVKGTRVNAWIYLPGVPPQLRCTEPAQQGGGRQLRPAGARRP